MTRSFVYDRCLFGLPLVDDDTIVICLSRTAVTFKPVVELKKGRVTNLNVLRKNRF